MDEERGGQVDVDELDVEFLGKEFVGQVQFAADVAQQVVEYEIVVAGCQYDTVEQAGHGYEVAYSQYKPYTYDAEERLAQHVQVVPECQFIISHNDIHSIQKRAVRAFADAPYSPSPLYVHWFISFL